MESSLRTLLNEIGLPPDEEVSVALAGQVRDDGWKAADVGRQDVESRRRVFNRLRREGLFPESVAGKTVLDVGCGIGSTGMALADQARLVVGIDLFRAHCISANECVSDQGWRNVALYQGSFLSADKERTVPFRARTFDYVISHHGLSRADILRVLPDIHATLVPGGRFYLFLPRWWFERDDLPPVDRAFRDCAESRHADWHELTLDCLVSRAKECGLREVERAASDDWTVLGDMLYMSDLFHSPEKYRANPITGVELGKSKVKSMLLVFRREG